nr:hypothetical protein [Tanacetum cinerariifolium]GFB02095.1 hypothetical protein [Tanacetum cinerariifolium]
LIPDGEETLALEREIRSKLNKDKVRPYDYTKLNSLYEIVKPPNPGQEMHSDLKYVESLEKEIDALESKKAKFSDMYDVILHDCVSKDVMCSYLQSLFDLDALTELQYLKAQMQDKNIAISELKKLIEKGKGKFVDTKFDRPSVVRQPHAQRIPKPSVLGKPTPFSDSLERRYFPKTRLVLKTNVSEDLSKPVVNGYPQRDKNKKKGTKPSTRLERARKAGAENILQSGPNLAQNKWVKTGPNY